MGKQVKNTGKLEKLYNTLGGQEELNLTYESFTEYIRDDEKANHLAGYLRSKGLSSVDYGGETLDFRDETINPFEKPSGDAKIESGFSPDASMREVMSAAEAAKRREQPDQPEAPAAGVVEEGAVVETQPEEVEKKKMMPNSLPEMESGEEPGPSPSLDSQSSLESTSTEEPEPVEEETPLFQRKQKDILNLSVKDPYLEKRIAEGDVGMKQDAPEFETGDPLNFEQQTGTSAKTDAALKDLPPEQNFSEVLIQLRKPEAIKGEAFLSVANQSENNVKSINEEPSYTITPSGLTPEQMTARREFQDDLKKVETFNQYNEADKAARELYGEGFIEGNQVDPEKYAQIKANAQLDVAKYQSSVNDKSVYEARQEVYGKAHSETLQDLKTGAMNLVAPTMLATMEVFNEKSKMDPLYANMENEQRKEMYKSLIMREVPQEDWGKGVVELASEGKMSSARKMLAMQLTQQVPQLAAMAVAPEVYGVNTGMLALGASSGTSKWAELRDRPDLTQAEKVGFSVTMGVAEFMAESIFRGDVDLARGVAKESGESFVKAVAKQFGEESVEEGIVGLVEQAINFHTDGEFDMYALADNMVVGGFFGGGIGTIGNMHKIAAFGPSSTGSELNRNQKEIIKDSYKEINEEIATGTDITTSEKQELAKKQEENIKEYERLNKEDEEFYQGVMDEDVDRIVKINQEIKNAEYKMQSSNSNQFKAQMADSIKRLKAEKKQIEEPYVKRAKEDDGIAKKAEKLSLEYEDATQNLEGLSVVDDITPFRERWLARKEIVKNLGTKKERAQIEDLNNKISESRQGDTTLELSETRKQEAADLMDKRDALEDTIIERANPERLAEQAKTDAKTEQSTEGTGQATAEVLGEQKDGSSVEIGEQVEGVDQTAVPPVDTEQTEREFVKESEKAVSAEASDAAAMDRIVEQSDTDYTADMVDAAKSVQSSLSELGTKVVVHPTSEAFREATNEGEVLSRGVYDPATNTIHLNAKTADATTAVHEGVHAALLQFASKQKGSPISDEEMTAMTDALFDSIRSAADKGGAGALDQMKDIMDKYYGKSLASEEALAEITGEMAADFEQLAPNIKNQIKAWLGKILDKIGIKGVYEKEMTDKQALDMLNTLASKLGSGATLTSEDLAAAGKVSPVDSATPQQASARFQADYSHIGSKTTFTFDTNSDFFKKLEEDGYLKRGAVVKDFDGKVMVVHQPDAAFSGAIMRDGELLVEGKGGMFYPMKFHEKGYFWASTEDAAEKMVTLMNKAAEQSTDGKARLMLVAAPTDKLLSSTTMSTGILDLFTSKSFMDHFGLSEAQMKRALVGKKNSLGLSDGAIKHKQVKKKNKKTGKVIIKKVGLQLPLNTRNSLNEIVKAVENKLAADHSNFPSRKHFSERLIANVAREIKDNSKTAVDFADFFGEGLMNEKYEGVVELKKGQKHAVTGKGLQQAVEYMLSEPMLRKEDMESGAAYAVLEMDVNPDGPTFKAVKAEEHESYPFAIAPVKEGEKTTINILDDRAPWTESFLDPETGKTFSEGTAHRTSQVLPSTAGITMMPVEASTAKARQQKAISREAMDRIDKVVGDITGMSKHKNEFDAINPSKAADKKNELREFRPTLKDRAKNLAKGLRKALSSKEVAVVDMFNKVSKLVGDNAAGQRSVALAHATRGQIRGATSAADARVKQIAKKVFGKRYESMSNVHMARIGDFFERMSIVAIDKRRAAQLSTAKTQFEAVYGDGTSSAAKEFLETTEKQIDSIREELKVERSALKMINERLKKERSKPVPSNAIIAKYETARDTSKQVIQDLRSERDELIDKYRAGSIQSKKIDKFSEPVKHPSELTGKTAQEELDKFKEMNPEAYAELERMAALWQEEVDKMLLEKLEAGFITQESYESVVGQFYNPRVFIEKLIDEAYTREAFGVKDSQARRKAVSGEAMSQLKQGSENELLTDPILLLDMLVKSHEKKMAYHNSFNAMNDAYAKNPAAFKQAGVKKVKMHRDGRGGYKSPPLPADPKRSYVEGFVGGQRVAYEVPTEFMTAFAGMNKSKVPYIVRWFTLAPVLKLGATVLNPMFSIANLMRDFHTNTIFTHAFAGGDGPMKRNALYQIARGARYYAKAMPAAMRESLGLDSQLKKELTEMGVGMDALFMDPESSAENLLSQRKFAKITGKRGIKIFSNIISFPTHFIEASEFLGRSAIYMSQLDKQMKDIAKEKGVDVNSLSDQDISDAKKIAADEARAVMDFGISGTHTNLAETIPYTNVAVRAADMFVYNVSPELAAAMFGTKHVGKRGFFTTKVNVMGMVNIAMAGALVQSAYSIMSAFLFDDEEEERRFYESVPNHHKEGGLVIAAPKSLGETAYDKYGNRRYIFLPYSQEFVPVVTSWMNMAPTGMTQYKGGAEGATRRTAEMFPVIGDMIRGIARGDAKEAFSPITNTPAVSALMAAYANYDTYRDQKIYKGDPSSPEYLKINDKTHPVFIKLGKMWNVSPAQLQVATEKVVSGIDNNFYLYMAANAANMSIQVDYEGEYRKPVEGWSEKSEKFIGHVVHRFWKDGSSYTFQSEAQIEEEEEIRAEATATNRKAKGDAQDQILSERPKTVQELNALLAGGSEQVQKMADELEPDDFKKYMKAYSGKLLQHTDMGSHARKYANIRDPRIKAKRLYEDLINVKDEYQRYRILAPIVEYDDWVSPNGTRYGVPQILSNTTIDEFNRILEQEHDAEPIIFRNVDGSFQDVKGFLDLGTIYRELRKKYGINQ